MSSPIEGDIDEPATLVTVDGEDYDLQAWNVGYHEGLYSLSDASDNPHTEGSELALAWLSGLEAAARDRQDTHDADACC